MRFLLDTHAFIWWTISTAQLSPTAFALLCDPRNEPVLSLVSLWEMQIKLQIGKLHLQHPLEFIIAEQQRVNRLRLLPLTTNHSYALGPLPFHHKDPFDRLLIAQAITETLPLVSDDTTFPAYPAQIIW